MTKSEVRAQMKKLEAEFLASGKADAETAQIWRSVEECPAFRNAGTVLAYMAIPGEVPTEEFIRKWMSRKRIAIPKVNGDSMDLYLYDPDRLQPGYKGIAEPSEDAVRIEPEEIDLALVPGVAFTKDGKRLGRGKGFYDRLLEKHVPYTIGIGFSFRWLPELPSDPWDVELTSSV